MSGCLAQETALQPRSRGCPQRMRMATPYQYRGLELEPRDDRYADGKIGDADRIKTGGGYYENAYIASYSNASQGSASGGEDVGTASPSTVVTNKLQTTTVRAEKKWRGNDEASSVTLELQYLATPSSAQPAETDWKSFTPLAAEVELDGEKDTDPTNRLWYEDGNWTAVWKGVPEYMPGSYRGESGKDPTQYRVKETLPPGFIQVDYDVASPSQAEPGQDDGEWKVTLTNTAGDIADGRKDLGNAG